MKNVTISLPEDVYRRARVKAAERDLSLSGLVRELLEGVGETESDFDRRRRLQDEVLASLGRFKAGSRLDRDRLHDRDALR